MIYRKFKALTIVLIILLSIGCGENKTTNIDTASGERIFGNVRNHFKQEPIRSALISVAGKSCTSDDTGYYSIDNVPLGNQSVSVSATGYSNYSASVSINASETNRYDVDMRPYRVPGTGAVWGYAYISGTTLDKICGAQVSIGSNDNFLHDTSSGLMCVFYICSIPSGRHNIIATMEGFWSYSNEITIFADSTILGYIFPMDQKSR